MLVNEFGRFVAHTRYDDLAPEVIETVKLRVLDVLGAALAGYRSGVHKPLQPIFDSPGGASVWGEQDTRSPRDAIVLNSFLAHALYLDDGSRYTGGHPSPVVIPSAIAVAETCRKSGRDLIAAVAAGYEVFLRLGRAIYPHAVVYGFHSTSVTGPISSAAACASLLGFDADMAKNAMAIACSLGMGLKEAHHCPQSQPIQVARACEAGLVAARFAEQGAEGADSIMEHGFLKVFSKEATAADILEGLGTQYRLFETYIKVHGGCRGNHAPIDVVQDLVKAHRIAPEDIARMVVRVDSVTYAAEIHAPANGSQAQFSVAFAIAVALLKGDASPFQYSDSNVADPRVRAMMKKIHVEIDRKLDEGYPEKRACSVEITLADGRRLEGYIPNAKGEPEQPFSRSDIENKFLRLTSDVLPAAGAVRDIVMALETVSDVSALTRLLKAAPS
jgi:2-methylcitrate dehydratase PrpD